MKVEKILIGICIVLSSVNVYGQLNVIDANTPPYTVDNLIRNVFLGSGVEVTNIVYEGDKSAVGYFDGGASNLGGLEKGIVLSTGFASNLKNENVSLDDEGEQTSNESVVDADLDGLATGNLKDIAKYSITFIPTSDTLRFRYVFASEEYPEFICSEFNDVFGFFITGPNPSGGNYVARNIALVPDPSDPSGLTFTNDVVSINNVHPEDPSCAASYEEYYNTNNIGTENFELNAYLDIFTAEAVVIPCEEYTIKLAIGDIEDQLKNSAVFLEAKSFGTGSLAVTANTLSIDGSLAEGCESGEIEFSLPKIVNEDFIIDLNFLNPPNAATPDVDYPAFPSQIVIPAGSSSVTIPLEAYPDNEEEGDEVISFTLQLDVCNVGNFEFILRDDGLLPALLPSDVTICEGESYNIVSELDPNLTIPDIPYFENTTSIPIVPEGEAIFSDIQVSGVFPTILDPEVIESVCIIGLEHVLLDNLDLYLVGPDGQFLELSTDNGNKPLNISDIDNYTNTCFRIDATENINRGNNLAGPMDMSNQTYTGNYLPEGTWSDIWDGQYKTNGTWRLMVIDDNDPGITGTLLGWSITFKSYYEVGYNWSASTGNVPCSDCPNIMVNPTEDTEYTLTLSDSYGCETSSSINVIVSPGIAKPSGSCDGVTQNSIDVSWTSIAGAVGYEIKIDNGPWVDVGLSLSESFNSLSSDTEFTIFIKANTDDCTSAEETLNCTTDPCDAPVINQVSIGETTCPSIDDASAEFTATGGTGPYTYEIGGMSNNDGVFTGLSQGENALNVTDTEGCISTLMFFVNGPDDFEFTPIFDLQDPCNVISDISGTIDVVGGTSPYNYDWGSMGTDKDITNLTPGDYDVTITDAVGCSQTSTLIIPQFNTFEYNVTTADPLCSGEITGSASIEILNGNPPYIYLWSDGSDMDTKNNLTAGNYSVTVTDDIGCEISKSFTINQGAELSVNITTNKPSCAGQNDGNAQAIVLGGDGNYTYSWPSGTTSENEEENLDSGTYNLTISDGNGCMIITEFEVPPADGIEYGVEKTDNFCSDLEQGRIKITASSSNGAIGVTWDDGDSNLERVNLAVGTYCFTISDGTACEVNECHDIGEPSALQAIYDIQGPKCSNGNDGTISVEPSGGTGPYNYIWEGPVPDLPNNSMVSGLESGQYMLTVSDVNNCQVVYNLDVLGQSNIEISPLVLDVLCNGENTGSINVNPSGGNDPYNYDWSGPNGFASSSESLKNLEGGEYDLILTDNVGCINNYSFLILEPENMLEANISANDSVCIGFSDGRLSVSPKGGTGPYETRWSNGENQVNNVNLPKGIYTVTITDIRGCKINTSGEIIERANIDIDITETSSLCSGSDDGSAEIVGIKYGGVEEDISSFSLIWNTSPPSSVPSIENLTGGATYTVVVEDRFGCQEIESIEISTPDSIQINQTFLQDVSCFGGSDAIIEVEGSGGNGIYEYQWGASNNFAIGSRVDMMRKGNYRVTVTDENGCSSGKGFEINEPGPLSMEFRTQDVNCYGDFSGSAETVVFGGTQPYSYNWSNGGTEKGNFGLFAQQYYISVTDGNACLLVDSIVIEEPESPLLIDVAVTDATCFESSDGKIEVDAIGGSGFYQYSLDDRLYSSTKKISNLRAGQYTIYVKDLRGCKDSFPDINLFEPNEIIVDLGNDKIIPFGSSVTLNSNVFNALGNVDYRWVSSNLDMLSCTSCPDPVFNGDREASFELIAIDANGCRGNDFIAVRLQNSSPLSVPTAFTPNDDGENDILVVFGNDIKQVNQFKIFDRWGELIYVNEDFDVNDRTIGWDGNFKGDIAPSGLYYWFADVEFINGFNESYNGNTTLIR